jgi:hypothetical protein
MTESPRLDDPFETQKQVLAALTQLEESLKELNDGVSPPTLSHYRSIPEAVKESYSLLTQGAEIIHASSTKYTLLGKLDATEQGRALRDIVHGCQLMGTACLVIHDDQTGCARPTRQHCKRVTRAVVLSVLQMIHVWVDQLAQGSDNNLGAQKAGTVWEKCNVIMEKRLPQGNRNCIRRDLLIYMKDCADTMTEFQDLIDQGPSTAERAEVLDTNDTDFSVLHMLQQALDGDESTYTENELPVATATLYLIKLSRGCINLSMQCMEEITGYAADHEEVSRLDWISKLYDLAHDVGVGVTDLGATMYPPLQVSSLKEQVEHQCTVIRNLLSCVSELREFIRKATNSNQTLSLDTISLFSKLETAFQKRHGEAMHAIEMFTS